MASIYTNIDKNRNETFLIISLFIGFLVLLGYVIGDIYYPGYGIVVSVYAFIFSGFSSWFSYYYSDKMVLSISGAKEISESDNQYLHRLVENLCIGAGLPKPKIYVIPDTAMNAFATGRDPEHAAICFTTGIIDRLDKIELEGVIAHELSHIGNFDIRLMTIVSVLVGTVVLVGDIVTRGVFYGSSSSRKKESGANGILILVGLLFIVLSPIIATLIKLAVSRNREYLADATAALLTRYPEGLASALEKLNNDKEILEAANGATAHLYISNPLKNNAHRSVIGNLFSTHPPTHERIARLRSM